ncbi:MULTISPECIES: sigma-70 family RNA polymerase sigma factor [Nannocystis]|uniref:RNA polymerase sigma factor n=1 Tax=Nannocystis radixulma TaxID=2995305 RepID=A0ABT5BAN2_9BACT|nr:MULTISPECIES: sigma-70 family RNA polymerase sigma factor [Nannocystis]MCY1062970.1 sigma-70 family RNA polymerase sigma factor [Nannocystis sp. SCPEA4]MDC0671157.1 sigma-70 family RNA polymerase sigma factor [Nannocystis radixulma]
MSKVSTAALSWLGFGPRKTQNLADLGDEALVQAAGRADGEKAFGELLRRHQGKVRGLLLRLTSDRNLADDLAQEVFLRAYRGLCGFEGRARFSTWLYRIAYNVYLNHRARVRELAALPENFEAGAMAPETSMSASRSDMRKDLDAAIGALPERYRAVVMLYYLEDVSYPEIAEILELPLGTVKTHLHRAKRMLREHLDGWGSGEVEAEDA